MPEDSQRSTHSVEFFEFIVDNLPFRYTTRDDDTTFNGDVFSSAAIKRENLAQRISTFDDELVIQTTTLDDNVNLMLAQWKQFGIEQKVTVKVWRQDLSDASFALIFSGVVKSVRWKESHQAELLCTLFDTSFKEPGPRRTWSTSCPYFHYGGLCLLVEGDFTSILSVTSISANGLDFTITGLQADQSTTNGDYIGGRIKKSSGFETRLIVDHVGDVVTIQYPFAEDLTSIQVDVSQGCDRTTIRCKEFNNLDNYGGFPFTPETNPFTEGLDKL